MEYIRTLKEGELERVCAALGTMLRKEEQAGRQAG